MSSYTKNVSTVHLKRGRERLLKTRSSAGEGAEVNLLSRNLLSVPSVFLGHTGGSWKLSPG